MAGRWTCGPRLSPPGRAVYGYIERQNLPGIFRTFDFASPDATSARRFYTTVPQQALFFLNSPFAVEAARGLVARPEVAAAKDDATRVRLLYRRLFARLPDAEETAAGVAYLRRGAPLAPRSVWSYGYGGWDGKAVAFTPFAVYAGDGYQPTSTFPDPNLGYVTLKGRGGHPGRDGAHATVRRWTAPADLQVRVTGVLQHGQDAGDGVRARVVVAGRLVGEWKGPQGRGPHRGVVRGEEGRDGGSHRGPSWRRQLGRLRLGADDRLGRGNVGRRLPASPPHPRRRSLA